MFHGCSQWFVPFKSIIQIVHINLSFFHLSQSCRLFTSIFQSHKSSVTLSFHDLCGLPLPWLTVTFRGDLCLIYTLCLSTHPWHFTHFILSFDSESGTFKSAWNNSRPWVTDHCSNFSNCQKALLNGYHDCLINTEVLRTSILLLF